MNIMMDKSGIKVNKRSIRIPPCCFNLSFFTPILLMYTIITSHGKMSTIRNNKRPSRIQKKINICYLTLYSRYNSNDRLQLKSNYINMGENAWMPSACLKSWVRISIDEANSFSITPSVFMAAIIMGETQLHISICLAPIFDKEHFY
jgi:hypothetical protein